MAVIEPITVWIGYDSREPYCSYVAAHSIKKRTRLPVSIRFLEHRKLREDGVFNRPWLIGGKYGEWTDILDGKTFSTEFSHTRFLVPHLMGYKGWALFMDADMVFLSDIKKLWDLRDDKYAAMCVPHSYPVKADTVKMDNRAQRFYRRKNQSSFCLWNCGHPKNAEVTTDYVNARHGIDLHSYSWLLDCDIGKLPFTYNYISGVSPKLDVDTKPDVIHYSDGGPWFPACKDVPYAELWTLEYEDWQRRGGDGKFSDVPTTKWEEYT